MHWYLYILLCDQKTYYIGITNNINKRIKFHKSGYSPFTKRFTDIKLVYKEVCSTRAAAEKREQQLKKWSLAKKKALVEGRIELLKHLSKTHGLCRR